jgi:hypothetical protein
MRLPIHCQIWDGTLYAVFRVTIAATGSALNKIAAASRKGAPGK